MIPASTNQPSSKALGTCPRPGMVQLEGRRDGLGSPRALRGGPRQALAPSSAGAQGEAGDRARSRLGCSSWALAAWVRMRGAEGIIAGMGLATPVPAPSPQGCLWKSAEPQPRRQHVGQFSPSQPDGGQVHMRALHRAWGRVREPRCCWWCCMASATAHLPGCWVGSGALVPLLTALSMLGRSPWGGDKQLSSPSLLAVGLVPSHT